MDKIKISGAIILGICIFLSGMYTGYAVYGNKIEYEEDTENKEETEAENAAALKEDKVVPLTKIVYKYYYTLDNKEEITEGTAPNFLIGKNRSEVEESMPEWEIESFSEKEIVMRKNIDEESVEYYIVAGYKGYVAAYSENTEKENLIEVTSTPISSLLPEEQEIIKKGIVLNSRYELSRCIENYSS